MCVRGKSLSLSFGSLPPIMIGVNAKRNPLLIGLTFPDSRLRWKSKSGNVGEKLYVDSLTNVLAVHLLRQYAIANPRLTTYEGGLPRYQLLQVLDYIHEHLDHSIKLSDLAQLLNMSQFHFSHLFKQSMGAPPYQYLIQQRVERAKQLLKQTDQSITEIAFQCGFNSHSHLTKQFRQVTGTTPRAYRMH